MLTQMARQTPCPRCATRQTSRTQMRMRLRPPRRRLAKHGRRRQALMRMKMPHPWLAAQRAVGGLLQQRRCAMDLKGLCLLSSPKTDMAYNLHWQHGHYYRRAPGISGPLSALTKAGGCSCASCNPTPSPKIDTRCREMLSMHDVHCRRKLRMTATRRRLSPLTWTCPARTAKTRSRSGQCEA